MPVATFPLRISKMLLFKSDREVSLNLAVCPFFDNVWIYHFQTRNVLFIDIMSSFSLLVETATKNNPPPPTDLSHSMPLHALCRQGELRAITWQRDDVRAASRAVIGSNLLTYSVTWQVAPSHRPLWIAWVEFTHSFFHWHIQSHIYTYRHASTHTQVHPRVYVIWCA